MTEGGAPKTSPTRPRAGVEAQTVLYLVYPLVVYWAHASLSTAATVAVLLVLYGVAIFLPAHRHLGDAMRLVRLHVPLGVFLVAAAASGNRRLLLLQPVAVNLYLLATFGWTLVAGPSMFERFGRAWDPSLPDFTHRYCRVVTLVWCAFFLLNAGATVVLSYAAPVGWWALYTGVLSYALVGLLIAGEACFRLWWFRYYGTSLLDRVFARLCPPERTARGRRSLAHVAARVSAAGDRPSRAPS